MCLNDWRIGRLIRPQFTSFDTSTGVGLTYPSNQQRVGIHFALRIGLAAVASLSRLDVDGNPVSNLHTGNYSRLFTLSEHGDLPMRAWTITKVGVDAFGCVTEFFAPEEVLQEALERYRHDYQVWREYQQEWTKKREK